MADEQHYVSTKAAAYWTEAAHSVFDASATLPTKHDNKPRGATPIPVITLAGVGGTNLSHTISTVRLKLLSSLPEDQSIYQINLNDVGETIITVDDQDLPVFTSAVTTEELQDALNVVEQDRYLGTVVAGVVFIAYVGSVSVDSEATSVKVRWFPVFGESLQIEGQLAWPITSSIPRGTVMLAVPGSSLGYLLVPPVSTETGTLPTGGGGGCACTCIDESDLVIGEMDTTTTWTVELEGSVVVKVQHGRLVLRSHPFVIEWDENSETWKADLLPYLEENELIGGLLAGVLVALPDNTVDPGISDATPWADFTRVEMEMTQDNEGWTELVLHLEGSITDIPLKEEEEE